MINCIIIDDDNTVRKLLSMIIKKELPHVKIVGEFDDAASALENMYTLKPDLVFLDMEMPGMNGLDFLKEMDDPETEVIVTTGYEQYAINALKMSVVDYLLKPIDKDELIKAVKRAEEKLKSKKEMDRYKTLVHNMKSDKPQSHKLGLTQHDAVIFVEVKDIIRCEASSNYTLVVTTTGKKIMVTKTLRQFEEILEPYGFIRVHRSHLVNPEHVVKLNKADGLQIEMSDGTQVDVSNSQKNAFLEQFLKL
jgi:two-component system, LytTR family, response regulator